MQLLRVVLAILLAVLVVSVVTTSLLQVRHDPEMVGWLLVAVGYGSAILWWSSRTSG